MEFTYETIGTNTFLTYMADSGIFDEFSLKMLEYNEIEGILPFSSILGNGNRKVRYAITSYETLESYIRRPLSLANIFNVLESIAKAALELEEYMLYTNGIVLDMGYMYVEIRTGKTRLIYLPVCHTENADVFGFLRGLLGKVQYEAPENAVNILKISNDINSGEIAGLKQLLDAIRIAKESVEGSGSTYWEKKGQGVPQQISQEKIAFSERTQVPPVAELIPQVSEIKCGETENEKKNHGIFGGGKKEKEKSKPKKDKKKEEVLLTPGFAIPGVEPERARKESFERGEAPKAIVLSSEKKGFFGSRKKKKEENLTEKSCAQVNVPVQPAMEMPVSPSLNFGETIISQPEEEATVVGDGSGQGMGVPYLLRRNNGQRMYLEKEVTKIGRESAYVDFYIGDNLQIGRNHAEIVRNGNHFFVRDNQSKNHTYVNGKMVTGNMLVPLEEGFILTLAKEDFEFHEN